MSASSSSYANAPAAVVVRINRIDPHPDADNLELIHFEYPGMGAPGALKVQCVTGPHYKARTEGVWFRAGAVLPGWLMEEMWLGKGLKTFDVREFPIRGQLSQGIFAGGVWRKTRDAEFEPWRFWKTSWTPGIDVSNYFGVWFRPLSSAAEQAVANREVAARENAPLGATPAVGSTSHNNEGANSNE